MNNYKYKPSLRTIMNVTNLAAGKTGSLFYDYFIESLEDCVKCHKHHVLNKHRICMPYMFVFLQCYGPIIVSIMHVKQDCQGRKVCINY